MKKVFGVIYLIIYVITLLLPSIDETNILKDAPFFHSVMVMVIIFVSVIAFISGIVSLIRGKHKSWEAVIAIVGSIVLIIYFLTKSQMAFSGSMLDIDRQINALISLSTMGYRLVLIYGVLLTYLGFVYDKKVAQATVHAQMYPNQYNVPPMGGQNPYNVPPMNEQNPYNVPPMENNSQSEEQFKKINESYNQGASMSSNTSQAKPVVTFDMKDTQEKLSKGFNKVKSKVDSNIKRKSTNQNGGTNAKYQDFVERYENDIDGLEKCVQVNIISKTN